MPDQFTTSKNFGPEKYKSEEGAPLDKAQVEDEEEKAPQEQE